MVREILVGALFLSLTACASVSSTPTPTPTPERSAPIAATPVPSAPVPTAPPVVAVPVVPAAEFQLVPFGARGAIGSVVVTAQGGAFTISVNARDLMPGSLHTVHLHRGSCATAYLGRHLLVLGTMAGNGAGLGAVSARLGFPYATARYVIVYSSLAAAVIIGCADLGAI